MTKNEKELLKLKSAIQKILVNMNEETHINKAKFVKILKKYAFLELKKEYILDCKIPKVYYEEMNYDAFGYFEFDDNSLRINQNCFNKYEDIMLSIDTIFHEMRHFAQYCGKRKDDEQLNLNDGFSIYCQDLVFALTHFAIKNTNIKLKQLKMKTINPNSEEFDNYFGRIYDKYHFMINDKYVASDEELDARQFALNCIYDIVFDIDKTKLNETELANLKNILDFVSDLFGREESGNLYTEASHSFPQQELIKEIKCLQKDIVEEFPMIFDTLATNGQYFVDMQNDNNFDISLALNQSLFFNYDEKLAHKLVGSYLTAIQDKNSLANRMFIDQLKYHDRIDDLYAFTNFELNAEETFIILDCYGKVMGNKLIKSWASDKQQYNKYLASMQKGIEK